MDPTLDSDGKSKGIPSASSFMKIDDRSVHAAANVLGDVKHVSPADAFTDALIELHTRERRGLNLVLMLDHDSPKSSIQLLECP